MDFINISQVFASQYINPDSSIKVVFPDTEGPSVSSRYDPERALIAGLDDRVLQKIHCFLHLQRKSGWSILELDQVIRILGWSVLNEQSIIDCWKLHRLQKELHISVDELLSWYKNIDTTSFEMGDDLSTLEMAAYTRLNVYQSLAGSQGTITFNHGSILGKAAGASITFPQHIFGKITKVTL